MKILFILGSLSETGGIQNYNRNFISFLKKTGNEVTLVERSSGGFAAKIFFTVKVFFLALFSRPDYMVCAHLHFAPLCLLLKKMFGFPYSVSVYGIEVVNINNIYMEALRGADQILHLFNAAAEDVVRQIPEVKDRMFNLPNSVDGGKFRIKEKSNNLVAHYGLADSAVVLTIGRMSKMDGDNKGYKRVIKAMPKVLESVPNAKYLLAGGGDDVPGIRKLITELGLEKFVILADAPTNEAIVDYYNLADVFVLPSKNEGFPAIVLLEALSCGVPIIGGNQRGAEEAMLDGELGLIVSADNIDEIEGAIIKMLRKEANMELFDKESLRVKALEVYGLESYQNQIHAFLAEIKK